MTNPSELKVPIILQPKQAVLFRLMERGARYLLFGGAKGGSKSHGIRAVNLKRRFQYPGTTSLIFRRTFPELLANHILKMLAMWPWLDKFYDRSNKIIHFPNGSKTFFSSGDDEKGIQKFQGWELTDLFIDQAEQLKQEEIEFLHEQNRVSGDAARTGVVPTTVLTANPGGIGHAYLKRLFVDRKFQSHENPEFFGYVFLPAFGWDNVEWARAALAAEKVSDRTYYENWTERDRFEFFVQRTEYGRNLSAKPARLRDAHLLGRWDVFEGQYFDVFDEAVHVVSEEALLAKPWHARWVSMDWGFEHNAVVLWWVSPGVTRAIYREQVGNHRTAEDWAHLIGRTMEAEREALGAGYRKPEAIFLSHDAFARKQDENTIARRMEKVLRQYGLPAPTVAAKARVSGWQALYDGFASRSLLITKSCPQLIESLQLMIRQDPDDGDPEDCVEMPGIDDPPDAARYGMLTRDRSEGREPLEDRLREKVTERDPTLRYIQAFVAEAKLKEQYQPIRRRRVR